MARRAVLQPYFCRCRCCCRCCLCHTPCALSLRRSSPSTSSCMQPACRGSRMRAPAPRRWQWCCGRAG
jgi:hypothetical protein